MKRLTLAISALLTTVSVYALDNSVTLFADNSIDDTISVTQKSPDDSDGNDVIIDLYDTELNNIDISQSSNFESEINVFMLSSQRNNLTINQLSDLDSYIDVFLTDSRNNDIDIVQTVYQSWIGTYLDNSANNSIDAFQSGAESGIIIDIIDGNENIVQVSQGSRIDDAIQANLAYSVVNLNNAVLNEVILSQISNADFSYGFANTIQIDLGLAGNNSTTEANFVHVAQGGAYNFSTVLADSSDNNTVNIEVSGIGNWTETVFFDENSDTNTHFATVTGDWNTINVFLEESAFNQLSTDMIGSNNDTNVFLFSTNNSSVEIDQK